MTSGKGVKGQDNEFGRRWMQNAKKRELTKFYPSKLVRAILSQKKEGSAVRRF
jgi:hypothetical protein